MLLFRSDLRTMETPRARGMGRSGPRRRTGCLTCRSRKVRCDEVKPACANCTRLRLPCTYKTIIADRISSRRINCQNDPAASATVAAGTPSDRPDVNFFHTVLCEDGVPASSPPRQPASDHPPTESAVDLVSSFDILGFIGEFTSDFQQKHLDLTTNGPSGLSAGPELASVATTTESTRNPAQTMNWASSADMSSISGSLGGCPSGGTDAPHHEQTPYEAGLFAHFETSNPPPTIFGPVDLDWKYVRARIVRQSRDCRAVLLGIYCYSEVHQTWVEGTAWDRNRKSRYHQLAWSEVQSCLVMKVSEPVLGHVFTTVLMLMLAEHLSSPDLGETGTSFLHSAYLLLQRFHGRTRLWTGVSRLISSWVSLLDVKALIAGREGDPLVGLGSLAPVGRDAGVVPPEESHGADEDSPEPAFLIREAVTGPAFQFLLQTQQILRRIVCIDLHHRNRGTVSDEFEVLQLAHQISADLETLWNRRPRVLDIHSSPKLLHDTLQPAVAREACRTFRQYIANFLAIFIYLHRVAFAIYPRTDRVHRAVEGILHLTAIDTQSPAGEKRHLPASFVWPLFVAGLEASLEQRQWILSQMKQMSQRGENSEDQSQPARHPHAENVYLLLQEMTRRQDASRTWADSRCVRRELFTDSFVMI
ncbi:Zn(II)2Cys6 transcription factor [Aspergillus fijiensis CBS 313.89]|uniref:Zn(II)2Cys6 transcription factor n=1 Tax=Aspergillus fijiensis CBS 313.89 TaxID=1448319 RepID=A0A8G1RCK2_9EURO|nr:Zn(II)2Cys6 transcription factor [Aspergillus fijiensis CBS 313.89]RAK71257.1 Zn(II)2Cys6 transcription factor [Aspergillus fijiensis CBS 313.89]